MNRNLSVCSSGVICMIIKPEIPFKTTEIHWEKSSRYVTISSQLQITASVVNFPFVNRVKHLECQSNYPRKHFDLMLRNSPLPRATEAKPWRQLFNSQMPLDVARCHEENHTEKNNGKAAIYPLVSSTSSRDKRSLTEWIVVTENSQSFIFLDQRSKLQFHGLFFFDLRSNQFKTLERRLASTFWKSISISIFFLLIINKRGFPASEI